MFEISPIKPRLKGVWAETSQSAHSPDTQVNKHDFAAVGVGEMFWSLLSMLKQPPPPLYSY